MVHLLAGTEQSAMVTETDYMSADVGDSVTLPCYCKDEMAMHFSWYKQTLGKNPQLISTIYKYDENASFYHEFKDSESNRIFVLQQPVTESVLPGDSVTLNCTIKTETCAGEHSVYWFRHGSGESHPGIIYTHGDRSGQCKNSTETGSPTQSCVYNLPKRNLRLSDAGTYYCAVVSCGEILFGNGTKLDIQDANFYLETEAVVRILVLLSIIRTGVVFCLLTILVVVLLLKNKIN
ncbi:hypothetical protein DPEC_G00103910 [Dallia pectoralis]|uniref:Uncharacterized protein n=1 Tax=Dallia pectoralis TaxID=75939 RepID=A0ACC2GXB4_DALPE|nr:hypothetical protein DPEC_G00103910 [Dallia pectoralis]